MCCYTWTHAHAYVRERYICMAPMARVRTFRMFLHCLHADIRSANAPFVWLSFIFIKVSTNNEPENDSTLKFTWDSSFFLLPISCVCFPYFEDRRIFSQPNDGHYWSSLISEKPSLTVQTNFICKYMIGNIFIASIFNILFSNHSM